MTTTSKHYRQGDVLIERINSLPRKLTKVALESGRVILAHGEVTGHAHAFTATEADKYVGADDAEYFEVRGKRMDCTLPIVRRWRSQVMVRHPRLGVIEFAEADITICGDTAVINGAFALLRHDEHTVQGIPAGIYKGAGATGTVHQREYSPEAIRNVAD